MSETQVKEISSTVPPAEEEQLRDWEEALEKGLKNFVDAGDALSEIRDKGLYCFGFDAFEDYCQKRWQLSRSYSYRLI